MAKEGGQIIMAGGKFDAQVAKTRPGTYINFGGNHVEQVGEAERGIVLIPLINHSYGPVKEFITLTNEAPDKEFAKLGYSIYQDNPQMLLIREAFKRASKVIVYITKTGEKATTTGGGITATALYGGSRGNDLRYNMIANPVSGFDVNIYFGENLVFSAKRILKAEELVDLNTNYIVFSAPTTLVEVAGTALTGGSNVSTENEDISTFLDSMESVNFNTLAFPVTDLTLQTACKSKMIYLRENVGKCIKAVIPDFKADYEGIINVTNSVVVNDKKLTHAEACAWVAGVDASASNIQSNTYTLYDGAQTIVDVKNHEQAVAAINDGEFFFSYSETGVVVVEYDINSLISFSEEKDKTYSKNRVLRVIDTFAQSIQHHFPPNKFDNDSTGWDVMEGIGKLVLKEFFVIGALKNVDYDSDFKVDRAKSNGDQTFFAVAIEPVDSAEKLYFTIKTK